MTPQRQLMLDFIREHIDRLGYPPSRRELTRIMGFASTNSTAKHLNVLRRDGHLTWDPLRHRSLELTC